MLSTFTMRVAFLFLVLVPVCYNALDCFYCSGGGCGALSQANYENFGNLIKKCASYCIKWELTQGPVTHSQRGCLGDFDIPVDVMIDYCAEEYTMTPGPGLMIETFCCTEDYCNQGSVSLPWPMLW